MIKLPRGGKWPPAPGHWFPAVIDGQRTARVTCPDCKESYVLDHAISAAGVVSPSVECPTKGCKWHVSATLEGWSWGNVPPARGLS